MHCAAHLGIAVERLRSVKEMREDMRNEMYMHESRSPYLHDVPKRAYARPERRLLTRFGTRSLCAAHTVPSPLHRLWYSRVVLSSATKGPRRSLPPPQGVRAIVGGGVACLMQVGVVCICSVQPKKVE